jgi:p-hydroxybenzoate 3-monooxygenase
MGCGPRFGWRSLPRGRRGAVQRDAADVASADPRIHQDGRGQPRLGAQGHGTEAPMKTQVAIIGGGPSGLLLSQLLHTKGIDSVVLERRTKDHVLSRIRAGVLEQGLIALMEEAGCADRLHAEGYVHDGVQVSYGDDLVHINIIDTAGKPVVVYGQTEVTRDLYAAREAAGGKIEFEAEDVARSTTPTPMRHTVTYHRPARPSASIATSSRAATASTASAAQSIPDRCPARIRKGLSLRLARHPVRDAAGQRRSSSMPIPNAASRSVRCATTGSAATTSSAADGSGRGLERRRLLGELKRRIPVGGGRARHRPVDREIHRAASVLRGEPMRWGRLFLCGDAAHIVPPTGRQGAEPCGLGRPLPLSRAGRNTIATGRAPGSTPTRKRP